MRPVQVRRLALLLVAELALVQLQQLQRQVRAGPEKRGWRPGRVEQEGTEEARGPDDPFPRHF